MPSVHTPPVAIDLFSGAGGLSEGLLSAGVNVAVAVECHPHPALTHAFNHPGTQVLCDDVRQVSVKSLRSCVKQQTGQSQVDVIVGGPPCQGFSSAGKQNRDDPRNELFRDFFRIVESFKPKVFLFENVPGFAELFDCQLLHTALDIFWGLGYKMVGIDNDSDYYPTSHPILNAVWYGVPQHRRRLFLMGWRGSLVNELYWPTPTHSDESAEVLEMAKAKSLAPQITVEQAMDDLSHLTAGYECHGYQDSPNSDYQRNRRRSSTVLFNHLASKHQRPTVNMFRRLVPGKTIRSIPKDLRSGKQRMRRLERHAASWAVLALPDDYIH